MNSQVEPLTVTIPLALDAHWRAEQARRYHSNPAKAKQVYLNTLAVYAVDIYLQRLGFETDLEASDSCDQVMQTLIDVADLEVKHHGKLECRPVLPNAEIMSIPAEVWDERIGYVAVQLDESLREATLRGFVEHTETEELALGRLRSLEDFPAYIDRFYQAQREKKPIDLSQWWQNIIDVGWETIDALFEPQHPQLAFRFRGDADEGIKRGKLLDLGTDNEPVALLVALEPSTTATMDISVEVYPAGVQAHLPQELQLMVLDEAGEAVMQAQARSTRTIKLEFSGQTGERFDIKLALGRINVTEAFIV